MEKVIGGCYQKWHPFSLWNEIKNYQIDDENSSFKFSDRLARENRWSREYTMRVIEEYKKFMFLACVSRDPVTPSIEVDECWHLHMLYTRDYWKEFTKVLGREIHHGPTKGGKQEEEKFVDWYQKTKEKYFMYFSTEPPEDIWPPSHIRFRQCNFVRVDALTNHIISANDWKTCVKAIWSYFKWKMRKLCGF